ncbi:hypothetical protein AA106555_1222 [Neokomagataea thailandica NBRC 106555]|uniref:Uncharacterized protein n=2 Tax=Neokomagataea TaxID=1223423 RepID=A0A4Y6V4T0_9PROT|nr:MULTISPECIES: hypothetical protein [Neokomagataea]QDH24354.1 hypothetical protein D5366_02725 [Neokomagataea tanensis]GBR53242.1 hypothetical protein AA106555_1222 [Neokomagataea thailandica NBRC 106555]
MPRKEQNPPFNYDKSVNRLATKAGGCAAHCVVQVMQNNRAGLVRESASLLRHLGKIWQKRSIDTQDVWEELEARLQLAEELREQGIRPTKNGRYRSTKLP